MPDGSLSTPIDRHGIGGNAPPDALALLRAELAEADAPARAALVSGAHALLLEHALADDAGRAAERAKLADALARVPAEFPDQPTADRGVNFAARLRRADKAEDTAREAAKRPYLDGGRAVDSAYKTRRGPLETGIKRLDALIAAYQRRKAAAEAAERARLEQERLAALAAAQELERQQREAAEAAARGAPVDAATLAAEAEQAAALRDHAADAALAQQALRADAGRLRTDHGALATVQVRWSLAVVDGDAIPRRYMVPDAACIDAALRADHGVREAMRAGDADQVAQRCAAVVPGCTLRPSETVSVRG